MNFINLRERNKFSIFTVMLLLLTITSLTLGVTNSFAATNSSEEEQAIKANLQNRLQNVVGRAEIKRFAFRGKKTTSLFSKELKPVLETLSEGDLDTTFGSSGRVTTQIGNSSSEALAVALQPDGKFVAAGYSFNSLNRDFALARYNTNGTLDTTFGTGGKVTTDIGNSDNLSFALAIQSDGKFVAGGNSFNGSDDDFALVRYKTDGTLDETFGTGGIVSTNFTNSSEYIDAVAIQSDGKIIAAGYRLAGSFFHFALARYNTNGTLDTTFGTGGKVTTDFTNFDDLARAVTLQPDGKIVIAGEADGNFALARYNLDGTLDTTFDNDGKVTTSINLFDAAFDVAVQFDGKILAAGEAGDGTNSDFALIRYDSSGALDLTFDADGVVTTAIGGGDEFAASLALQTGGKIIVGGFSSNGANDDFALVRYNPNGTLDTSFGAGGKVTTDFSSSYDYVSAVALQSNNRIIAVGSANTNFAAAAYSLGTAECTYALSAASASFPSAGGTGSFNVSTGNGCAYVAASNVPWITFTGGSGNGNGLISFSVAANLSIARTGIITVGGQTFTVSQASGKSRKRVRFVS